MSKDSKDINYLHLSCIVMNDTHKAFLPAAEPKFARPKPSTEPIREYYILKTNLERGSTSSELLCGGKSGFFVVLPASRQPCELLFRRVRDQRERNPLTPWNQLPHPASRSPARPANPNCAVVTQKMPRPNGGGKKFNNPKFLSDELFELAGGASKEMMSDVKPPQRALDLQVEDDFVLLPEGDDENSSPNKPLSKVTQMPAFAARKRKQEKDGINEVKDWQNNFLERMEKQVAARSKSKECLLRSLSTVSEMLEANQVTLKESEQSLQLLMGNILKRNKHMLAAHNQCVNAIKEIQHNYQKECELQESRQREASRADAEEMADKVNALMEKLIKESRRSQMEKLRKSMKYAMEFDM